MTKFELRGEDDGALDAITLQVTVEDDGRIWAWRTDKPIKSYWSAAADERRTINVPDCYADPRFDSSIDRASGFRTRCSLTLPLIDHLGDVIGAMQLLNRHDGVFDPEEVPLAEALAAQCAMALARARMTQGLIEAERMHRELALAATSSAARCRQRSKRSPATRCAYC